MTHRLNDSTAPRVDTRSGRARTPRGFVQLLQRLSRSRWHGVVTVTYAGRNDRGEALFDVAGGTFAGRCAVATGRRRS